MVRFVLDDDKVYKVVAESDDAIWVIDYDNPCAPKMVKQDGLVNLEEIPVPDDYMQESVVSRAIYDTAKKRLGILSAILSDNAYITNAALRQRAIAKIAQDARVSQKTLKRWYYSYLAYGERGLCPASKIKKSKTLPQEHEKKIASALSKYYYSPKKRSLKTTYEMMLLKYYRNEQRIIVPDHPTYGQFLYYYRKNRDVVRKLISREGIGEYQKNARPLLGKGDAGITTIGYFEIDATVADIYVVSRFDRKPIGRPVLYVAIDIASRMIAGIYVGFEESAEAVLTCLANAACDKVDFCKEHGISITADMWPSKGLPGTIYTDRGSDFASFRVKELCSTFNMEITTLPPYRPDLKGYPRTNSSYLATNEVVKVDAAIKGLAQNGITGLINKPKSKSIYDDSKIEAHSAITPTGKWPGTLSGAQKTVYECILNRFCAVFCEEDCTVDRTTIVIHCYDEDFCRLTPMTMRISKTQCL